MRQPPSPLLVTLLLLAILVATVWSTMSFITGTLGMHKAYWLFALFGALGGAIAGARRENKLELSTIESGSKVDLGFVGDIALGIAAASAVVFLFGATLRFDPDDPDSYVLLISISLIAGIYGRNVIEVAGEKFRRQVREEAKAVAREEAELLVGQPAAVAYTAAALETIKQGIDNNTPQSFEKGLTLAELALKHDPKWVNAYIEKGRALKRLGRIEEALRSVQEALAIQPSDPKALYNRACYNCLLGKPKEQILPDLKKAFDAFPKLRKHARTDPDLDNIHNLPEFNELVGNQSP